MLQDKGGFWLPPQRKCPRLTSPQLVDLRGFSFSFHNYHVLRENVHQSHQLLPINNLFKGKERYVITGIPLTSFIILLKRDLWLNLSRIRDQPSLVSPWSRSYDFLSSFFSSGIPTNTKEAIRIPSSCSAGVLVLIFPETSTHSLWHGHPCSDQRSKEIFSTRF